MVDTQVQEGDFMYDVVNEIAGIIAAPGKWFIVDSNGICFGVAFLAVVGMTLAAFAITFGIN